MRMTIIAFGTRGDVQPTLALGKALKTSGHDVRMIAGANFESWIAQHGLEAVAASVDIQEMMMGEGGHDWVEHGNSPFRQMQVMKRLLAKHGPAMMRDAFRACEDADVVLSNFTSDVYAVSIAEKVGAHHISIPLQPALVATRSGVATPQAPRPDAESVLNYLFGRVLIEPFGWRLMGSIANRFRRETLGLPAQTARENLRALRRMPTIQGYSSHVVPHPKDWPPNIRTAGYWFLDEAKEWQPPPGLVDFIRGGEAPAYIGFGSMTGRDPGALTRLVVDAAEQTGQRAIIQSGWAGVGDLPLPPNMFRLDAAPHNWLFPQMSAAVHHGGAGTTAESLRAGVPTVIVPHMADQPFWGARVAALGVGPPPIPRNRLTPDNLASAIRLATGDMAVRERSAELGAKLRAEDGIATAVGMIEEALHGAESGGSR